MMEAQPILVSVNISSGGVPKRSVKQARVTFDGIEGDGRSHAKHIKPTRAVSLLDLEILETLQNEGYPVSPGVLGENLTVRSGHLQTRAVGTQLHFSGGVVVELVEPRKPCFVLKEIHPDLETRTIGQIGFMGRVICEGIIRPGEQIALVMPAISNG